MRIASAEAVRGNLPPRPATTPARRPGWAPEAEAAHPLSRDPRVKRERQFCYATGNDVDWYQELGYRAFKLACPYGPADGLEGLARNEELVASAREQIGDGCELMLDCWMAFDVEYAVRLAERLRPY